MTAGLLSTIASSFAAPLTLGLAEPLSAAGAHGASGGVSEGPFWAVLVLALPFLAFVLNALYAATGMKTRLPAWTTVAALAGAFLAVVALFVARGEPGAGLAQIVHLWDWIHVAVPGAVGDRFEANFAFYIDSLTILWMLFVTGLATLIALYASEYMGHDVGLGYCRFFAAFSLFVVSMTCLVMADNLVLLYLGWEGVGLCSYLLIGYFYKKPSAVAAAKKAFIVNRIGDLGLALGIWLAFTHFGTVEYAEIFASEKLQAYLAAASAGDFSAIPMEAQGIALLLMVGAFGKSAQFPLYVWLPDAMEGPTPVSALIHAATMVTAGIYLIARMYPVFLISEHALPIVAWIGTITALLAATIGMAQFDIKRIMAYSTVSQLGYMFAGLGVLSTVGAAYHVLTHAFFKALLFLACGAVMHGFAGQLDLRRLSGLWSVPGWRIVTIAMFVGCLNLAGFPLTAGYFSKDTILAEAFVTPGGAVIGWILLFTAGLTAYYTFRVFYRVFTGPVEYHPGEEFHADAGHHDAAHHAGDPHAAADAAEEKHFAEKAHDPHTDAGGHAGHGGFHPHAPGWAINSVLAVLAVVSILATGLYFVGGGEATVGGQHVKTKHYAANMVQNSSAAFVTPYDHHAFHADHDAHPAEDDASRVAAGEAPSYEHTAETTHPTHAGPGVGPRGEIAEPRTLFGEDPHKVMYFVSAVFGIVGILIAAVLHAPKGSPFGFFLGSRTEAGRTRTDAIAARLGPIPKWAENKWYVDEFYNFLVRVPLLSIAHISHWIDKGVVDGIVNGFGALPRRIGRGLRPSQSGVLHGYAAGMVGGIAVLLVLLLVILVAGRAFTQPASADAPAAEARGEFHPAAGESALTLGVSR